MRLMHASSCRKYMHLKWTYVLKLVLGQMQILCSGSWNFGYVKKTSFFLKGFFILQPWFKPFGIVVPNRWYYQKAKILLLTHNYMKQTYFNRLLILLFSRSHATNVSPLSILSSDHTSEEQSCHHVPHTQNTKPPTGQFYHSFAMQVLLILLFHGKRALSS